MNRSHTRPPTLPTQATMRHRQVNDQEQELIHPRGTVQFQLLKHFPQMAREGAQDNSPRMPGRRLASTTKRVVGNKRMDVDISWDNGCPLADDQMYLAAVTYPTRNLLNGSLSSSSIFTNVIFGVSKWTCEPAYSYFREFTEFYFSRQDSDYALVIDKNFDSFSYSLSYNGTSASELCSRACEEPDENGNEQCYVDECEVHQERIVPVTVAVQWPRNVTVLQNSSSNCKSSTVTYRKNTVSTVQEVSGSVNVTLSIDGVAYVFPALSTYSGKLFRSFDTEITTVL